MSRTFAAALCAGLLSTACLSAPLYAKAKPAASHTEAEARTLALAKQLVAIKSVEGPGNQTIVADKAIADALVAGGWTRGDIDIVPMGDTAYIIASWLGSDPKLKPLVISGHLDVVAADPKDWERDPFTPVIEDGFLFGRGASDMKLDAASATSALIELRRSGYKPRRTIVLQFSGDEETTMKTSRVIADRLKNAEVVINIDGGGGALDEKTGKPAYWSWDGAEKMYNDYTIEVTNPGGHSSAPRPENAIVQLSTALKNIGEYSFPVEQNPLTKAYFENAAAFESDPKMAAAMRAFAADMNDKAAVATLRSNPSYVGKVSTTCVPTQVNAGHARNALPQRARANVNCRIFPGHSREEIRALLEKVAGVPQASVRDATGDESIASPASPMRADVLAAMTKAIRANYPGIPIIPTQASGASDSMYYRALGVPSYGASPTFIKDSDSFAHGLNERVPLSNIAPGLRYYMSLFTDLSK
ncbi:M20/M25/M40 family metallo-hydrolase [Novosphingobium sp. MW5]|nr:M20/M25/M40 family metallo-hydrolase [Novosphingobium sp. MW5]